MNAQVQNRVITVRPPRIAQGLAAAAAILHWTTPLREAALPACRGPGLILGMAGCGIMLWAWWLFRVHGTVICPTDRAVYLVTRGVYRLSRNPMYLGITGMLLGLAVFMGTFPFYLAAVVFFLVIDRCVCPYEESVLDSVFGREYQSYRSDVRRWL